jgi:hypothetical protein
MNIKLNMAESKAIGRYAIIGFFFPPEKKGALYGKKETGRFEPVG